MLIAKNTLPGSRPQDRVARWLTKLDYALLLDGADISGIPVIERFDWQGGKIEPGFRRVRVMARQTFVLCQAGLAGIEGAATLAERAAKALIGHGVGDHGQFLCRLSPDGQVLDATPDLYDIAFGLFAMAWWYRLSGDRMALSVAERSVAHLHAAMRSPSGIGFVSRLGETTCHEQNPHMHLFEAAIMLAEFGGKDIFVQLADSLFALASTRMFDSTTATLPELFDDEWRPIGDPAEGGAIRVEPGHHYEWVWLLTRYAALSGNRAAFDMADRLYDFAQTHGHDAVTGLIFDAVGTGGDVIGRGLRLWPNTEYLKAQVVMRERLGTGFDDGAIAANVDRIFDRYLTPPASGPACQFRDGLWIDYLDADAVTPKCDHVPASSLYHIVFAFSELLGSGDGATSHGPQGQDGRGLCEDIATGEPNL